MKRKFLASALTALAFCCLSPNTFAQDGYTPKAEVAVSASKSTLIAKLKSLAFFTANFTQQVLSDSGQIIEESTGKLAISKPNLANWQVLTPDELSIVSDGEDVWFYNPWIEQVSIYSLSSAIARTPILLLTNNDPALWQQYNVEQLPSDKHQDTFVITAIDTNSQIKNLTLVFDAEQSGGQLNAFSFLDATGQLSQITLTAFNQKTSPKPSLFKFVIPEDTQIDDQR